MKKTISMCLVFLVLFHAFTFLAYAEERMLKKEDIPIAVTESEILQKLNMISGTGKGLELERDITITESITLIWRVTGLAFTDIGYITPSFNDISGHWGEDTIEKFYHAGLVKGTTGETFEPNRRVKGREFVTILLSAMGYEDIDEENAYQKGLETDLLNNNFTKSAVLNDDYLSRSDAIRLAFHSLIAIDSTGNCLYITLIEKGLYDESDFHGTLIVE